MLQHAEKLASGSLSSSKVASLITDSQIGKLRTILLQKIDQFHDNELFKERDDCLLLVLRVGLVCGSAEDLLLAASLQAKYKVDITAELESLC